MVQHNFYTLDLYAGVRAEENRRLASVCFCSEDQIAAVDNHCSTD